MTTSPATDLSRAHDAVAGHGFAPLSPSLPTSDARFPEGGAYRIEIPSCEGPAVTRAVVDEVAELGVRVHRVSQGSGVMMQTDNEIAEMVELAAAEVPDLVRHCAPVFSKLGVRNAPNIYPTGRHHEPTAIALGRERVRRAALVLRLLEREGLR